VIVRVSITLILNNVGIGVNGGTDGARTPVLLTARNTSHGDLGGSKLDDNQ
jgi:hypothetical protein